MVGKNKASYFVLLLFSLALLLPGIAKLPVIDRDEAHFAQASRQMLQTGNFFQIRFQDTTRFQKPPGINWLQAVSVKLFSSADSGAIWPYRIPSVLSALASTLLCFFLALKFGLNRRNSILAAGLLTASLLFIVEAHMAVIDAALLLTVLVMQTSLWLIYQHERISKFWPMLFWLSMALGIVLKGVTPLVAIGTIGGICLQEKKISWLQGLYLWQGVLTLTLITFTWLILVSFAENSNYLMQMLYKDLLPKLKGGHESHGYPPFYHLAILPATFWPSSLFLAQGLLYAIRNRYEKKVIFLTSWIVPTWLFFELMPTKLPQYLLPLFPAFAILCALAIQNCAKFHKVSLHLLQIFWGILSISIIASLIFLSSYLLHVQISKINLLILLVAILILFIVLACAWRQKYTAAGVGIFAIATVIYPWFFKSELPTIKSIWLTQTIAKEFTSIINKGELSVAKPLLAVDFNEPSLVFNLNTKLVKFTDLMAAEKIIKTDPERIALVSDLSLRQMGIEENSLTIIASVEGYNYNKGRWIKLHLVKKRTFK